MKLSWHGLDKLREEAKCIKHRAGFGDPKVYIETTDEGLNFETPPERVSEVF